MNNLKKYDFVIFHVFCLFLFTNDLNAQDQSAEEDLIRQTLNHYLEGGTNNNFTRLAKAFHSEASMKFVGGEAYKNVNALDFFRKGMKPGPPQNRTTQIEYVDIIGNAAHAKLSINYPTFRFLDFMNLLKVEGEWKIVSKIFYKEIKTPENDLKTAALDLLDRWTQAYLDRDFFVLENILAENYTYQGSLDGKKITKTQSIEGFRKANYSFKDIQMEDVQVRTFGNTAILTGKETLILEENGKITSLQLRFTDVYTIIGGWLQAVSTHSSPIE